MMAKRRVLMAGFACALLGISGCAGSPDLGFPAEWSTANVERQIPTADVAQVLAVPTSSIASVQCAFGGDYVIPNPYTAYLCSVFSQSSSEPLGTVAITVEASGNKMDVHVNRTLTLVPSSGPPGTTGVAITGNRFPASCSGNALVWYDETVTTDTGSWSSDGTTASFNGVLNVPTDADPGQHTVTVGSSPCRGTGLFTVTNSPQP
jgi:hypothetical protein